MTDQNRTYGESNSFQISPEETRDTPRSLKRKAGTPLENLDKTGGVRTTQAAQASVLGAPTSEQRLAALHLKLDAAINGEEHWSLKELLAEAAQLLRRLPFEAVLPIWGKLGDLELSRPPEHTPESVGDPQLLNVTDAGHPFPVVTPQVRLRVCPIPRPLELEEKPELTTTNTLCNPPIAASAGHQRGRKRSARSAGRNGRTS